MICLFLIGSGFYGFSFGHKQHCNIAQINTQRYTDSSSISLSTSHSVWYHVGMITLVFNRCFIALAAVSTVENSHIIVSRALTLSARRCCLVSVPLSWRQSYCHCDPSLPAQQPVHLGLHQGSAGPPRDPGSHLSDWTWWQSSSGTWGSDEGQNVR